MKNRILHDRGYSDENLPMRLDSWITTVLKNLVYNEVRKYYRDRVNHPEALPGDLEERLSYDPFSDLDFDGNHLKNGIEENSLDSVKAEVSEALSRISPQKKRVIEAYFLLDIPIKVIAKKLGLAERIVSDYKYRALRELREMLDEEAMGDE